MATEWHLFVWSLPHEVYVLEPSLASSSAGSVSIYLFTTDFQSVVHDPPTPADSQSPSLDLLNQNPSEWDTGWFMSIPGWLLDSRTRNSHCPVCSYPNALYSSLLRCVLPYSWCFVTWLGPPPHRGCPSTSTQLLAFSCSSSLPQTLHPPDPPSCMWSLYCACLSFKISSLKWDASRCISINCKMPFYSSPNPLLFLNWIYSVWHRWPVERCRSVGIAMKNKKKSKKGLWLLQVVMC